MASSELISWVMNNIICSLKIPTARQERASRINERCVETGNRFLSLLTARISGFLDGRKIRESLINEAMVPAEARVRKV